MLRLKLKTKGKKTSNQHNSRPTATLSRQPSGTRALPSPSTHSGTIAIDNSALRVSVQPRAILLARARARGLLSSRYGIAKPCKVVDGRFYGVVNSCSGHSRDPSICASRWGGFCPISRGRHARGIWSGQGQTFNCPSRPLLCSREDHSLCGRPPSRFVGATR